MATNLVPKTNVTSPIWRHFGFEPDVKGQSGNLDKAISLICRKKVSVSQQNDSDRAQALDLNT